MAPTLVLLKHERTKTKARLQTQMRCFVRVRTSYECLPNNLGNEDSPQLHRIYVHLFVCQEINSAHLMYALRAKWLAYDTSTIVFMPRLQRESSVPRISICDCVSRFAVIDRSDCIAYRSPHPLYRYGA